MLNPDKKEALKVLQVHGATHTLRVQVPKYVVSTQNQSFDSVLYKPHMPYVMVFWTHRAAKGGARMP